MDQATGTASRPNFARLSRWRDNLMNFVTALGTSRDPTTSSTYNYVDLDRFTLENAYRSDWIARRVIDSPADDATREWRHWNASQNQIEALEAAENDLQLRKKVKQWIIRARLYGGAALVIGVDDGHESWEPLDLDNIGKDSLQFVVVMNRYELNAGPRIYNVSSRWYTRPEYYTVATPLFGFSGELGEAYPGTSFSPLMVPQREQGQAPPGGGGGQSNVVRLSRGPAGGFGGDPYKQVTPVSGMVRLHPSRVIELAGNELPDWRLAPMGGGWGDSVLQTVDESLKDWGLTVGAMANMVNDAKTDIIKVKDFAQKITTNEYQTRLLNRWALANISKSTVNALVLDKEEEWQRIQTNFGGLAELLREYMVVISGATNIPISRLFGQSSGRGLGAGSSGGEQDLKNYYDAVASWQRNTVTPVMEWLDQALIRSTLGGAKPGVYYEWAPLWQMSDTEKAEMALKKAQAYQIDVQMGQINEDALRHARISQLIEDGTYPGLDDAIDQYGEEPDVPEARLYSPGIDPVTGLPIAPGGAPKPPGGGGFGGGGSQPPLPAPSGAPPQPPKPAAVSRETQPAKDGFNPVHDTDFFTDPDGSVRPIRGSEGYVGNGGSEERTTTPPPPDVKKGGMSHADVRAAADKVADKLGFDKGKIDVSSETKKFMLNGKEHDYAGAAYLDTGRVVLYSDHLSPEHVERDPQEGAAAMIEKQIIEGRPALVAYMDDKFNPVHRGKETLVKVVFTDPQGGSLFLTPSADARPSAKDSLEDDALGGGNDHGAFSHMTASGDMLTGGTRTALVHKMLRHPEGATRKQVKAATGWSRVSLHEIARRGRMHVLRSHANGEVVYKGVPGPAPMRTAGQHVATLADVAEGVADDNPNHDPKTGEFSSGGGERTSSGGDPVAHHTEALQSNMLNNEEFDQAIRNLGSDKNVSGDHLRKIVENVLGYVPGKARTRKALVQALVNRQVMESRGHARGQSLGKSWGDAGSEDEPRNEKGEWTSGGGDAAVEHHKAKLKAAIAEPEDFEKTFAGIQRLDTPTLKKLARSFLGRPVTSRAEALNRIKSRHTQFMVMKARAKSASGRSAG